jgi:hypothetical protein
MFLTSSRGLAFKENNDKSQTIPIIVVRQYVSARLSA